MDNMNTVVIVETQVCNKCDIEKVLNMFKFRNDTNNYRRICMSCGSKQKKNYYETNKEEISLEFKEYRKQNKKYFKEYGKEYREKNSEQIKKDKKVYYNENRVNILEQKKSYFEENKDKINTKRKYYYNNNYIIKLHKSASGGIKRQLKALGIRKNGKTFSKYLKFSKNQLIKYLELLFDKSWMNWDNQGKYNPKIWNDNDPKTWTWNLDHIKPISHFKNIIDENSLEFQECWNLK